MHLLRTAPLITLTLACLAVPATVSAASATSHATAPTPTRLVIYKGDGKGDGGPKGDLSTTKWTVSTAPETIETNDGTLVENTALTYPGDTPGGEWWYKVGPTAVVLHAFDWKQTNGTTTEATNLQNLPDNNFAWYNLGGGLYSPRCLEFSAAAPGVTGTEMYFQITKKNGDWQLTTSAKACKTAP